MRAKEREHPETDKKEGEKQREREESGAAAGANREQKKGSRVAQKESQGASRKPLPVLEGQVAFSNC